MSITIGINTVIGETAPASYDSASFTNAPIQGVNSLFLSRHDATSGYAVLEYSIKNGWSAYGNLATISESYNDKPAASGLPIKTSEGVFMAFSATTTDVSSIWNLNNSTQLTGTFTETVIASLPLFNEWLVANSSGEIFIQTSDGSVTENSLQLALGDSLSLMGEISINGVTYLLLAGANTTNSEGNSVSPFAIIAYDGTELTEVFSSSEFTISAALFNFNEQPTLNVTNPNTYDEYLLTPNETVLFTGTVGQTYIDNLVGSAGNLLIGEYYSATKEAYVLCGIPNLSEIYKENPQNTTEWPTFQEPLSNGWMGFGRTSDNEAYPVILGFTIQNPLTLLQPVRNYCHNYSRGVPVNFGGNLSLPATYNVRKRF